MTHNDQATTLVTPSSVPSQPQAPLPVPPPSAAAAPTLEEEEAELAASHPMGEQQQREQEEEGAPVVIQPAGHEGDGTACDDGQCRYDDDSSSDHLLLPAYQS